MALNILVLTSDERLALDVERVVEERAHVATRVNRLRDLQEAMVRESPDVLLLDVGGSVSDTARVAATVAAVHPGVAVVLAVKAPPCRSESGFRVVDKWRTAERVVDELELAYIGIPPSIEEPLQSRSW